MASILQNSHAVCHSFWLLLARTDACVRACMRACVGVCVRERVRACVAFMSCPNLSRHNVGYFYLAWCILWSDSALIVSVCL